MRLISLNKVKKKNKGFTLLELILVLGIGSLAFIGFIQMEQKRQENLAAENAGGQIYEVGQALAQYINLNNSFLISAISPGTVVDLTTAVGGGNPLSVMEASGTSTVIGGVSVPNRLLLPTTYINRLGFPTVSPITYNLYLKNNAGTIVGLILTNSGIVDKSGSTRYDWGGIAMKKAGSQAGISFGNPNQLNGLNGAWSLANTDFTPINTLGKLGYRVAYQGTFDSTYLRLDGLYPMNGNLNMGNYNIKNATDISYTGWLYGNNGVMNNLLTGTITNAGNITTQSINGKTTTLGTTAGTLANTTSPGSSYANFDLLYTNCINCGVPGDLGAVSTQYNVNNGDVRIGKSGNAGTLFVKDILLSNVGSGLSTRNGYLSDRLPRYADRGVAVVPDGNAIAMPAVTTLPSPGYYCRWSGEGNPPVPKIEVIPAMQWVQGAVLGTQQLSFAGSYINAANQLILNGSIYQDQYSLGAFQAYAVATSNSVLNGPAGSWTIYARTPAYNGSYSGGTALVHVYCDYGA